MKGNIIGSLFLFVLVAVIGWVIWNGSRSEAPLRADGRTTLMDFYADWCGPCRMMKPVVHELSEELRGKVNVMEINVDASPDLSRQFNVQGIPCFIVTRDGREVGRQVGVTPKENLRRMTGF
jgi:thioredoxin 1